MMHAALTYYYANQQEIEAALSNEDAEAEALLVAFQELCKQGEIEDVFGHIGKT